MPKMRAKVRVVATIPLNDTIEDLVMVPVCKSNYGSDGSDENNTYARWTPSGEIKLGITNPNLVGQFNVKDEYYVDFKPVPTGIPKLPGKGVEVPFDDLVKIATAYGWDDVVHALLNTPRPDKPFKSDGCSCWPDSWFNVSIYKCCFRHDIHYWCGCPGDDLARLKADCQLAIDVAETTNNIKLAETMFAGVRAGGVEDLELSFSWGFGRD